MPERPVLFIANTSNKDSHSLLTKMYGESEENDENIYMAYMSSELAKNVHSAATSFFNTFFYVRSLNKASDVFVDTSKNLDPVEIKIRKGKNMYSVYCSATRHDNDKYVTVVVCDDDDSRIDGDFRIDLSEGMAHIEIADVKSLSKTNESGMISKVGVPDVVYALEKAVENLQAEY